MQPKLVICTSNCTLASLIRSKISCIYFCSSSWSRNFLNLDLSSSFLSFLISSSRLLNNYQSTFKTILSSYFWNCFIHCSSSLLPCFQLAAARRWCAPNSRGYQHERQSSVTLTRERKWGTPFSARTCTSTTVQLSKARIDLSLHGSVVLHASLFLLG